MPSKDFFHHMNVLIFVFIGLFFLSSAHAQAEPDVYVLKEIIIPPDFGPHQSVPADSIEIFINVLTVPTNPDIIMDYNILTKNGKNIYSVQNLHPALAATIGVKKVTLNYSALSAADVQLVDGDSYTLLVTVSPANKEVVRGNNKGAKTFVSLKPAQSFSIPDSPWWMSILVAFFVLSVLYASEKKPIGAKRIQKK